MVSTGRGWVGESCACEGSVASCEKSERSASRWRGGPRRGCALVPGELHLADPLRCPCIALYPVLALERSPSTLYILITNGLPSFYAPPGRCGRAVRTVVGFLRSPCTPSITRVGCSVLGASD